MPPAMELCTHRCRGVTHDWVTRKTHMKPTNAEKSADDSRVLMATGETFLILGDNNSAMKRYARALDAPGVDRTEVRLALARLFAESGRHDDAQQQVAFALAEARVGEATAVTPENLVEAGRVLVSINQFQLARK